MIIIGADQGNKQMKTANCLPFVSGLKKTERSFLEKTFWSIKGGFGRITKDA